MLASRYSPKQKRETEYCKLGTGIDTGLKEDMLFMSINFLHKIPKNTLHNLWDYGSQKMTFYNTFIVTRITIPSAILLRRRIRTEVGRKTRNFSANIISSLVKVRKR